MTNQTQTPNVTIRKKVQRVVVDVTVLDEHGKPVEGLKAEDFTIEEDKQPQRILSFDAYELGKPSIFRGPNPRSLPPNVFVNVPNTPEHGPLYVILYDLVNTEIEDQMKLRGQILRFINSKPAGTRFAIFVYSDNLVLAQGFTDDQDQLRAALDGKHEKHRTPRVFLYGRNYGRGNPYDTVAVLTYIGKYLDGIPGRKNLIWISGGFPLLRTPEKDFPLELDEKVRSQIDSLAQAEIAVFPFDVKGVVLYGSVNGGPATSVNSPHIPMTGAGVGLHLEYGNMDYIASMTGGRAFYSTNDLIGALEEATDDGGSYYTLTYAPPIQEEDSKCHKITVKTDKPSYQLSYRSEYCRAPVVTTAAENDGANLGPSVLAIPVDAGDVLQANMKQGAPMLHDLIFSVHLHADGQATMATAEQMAQLQWEADYFLTHTRNKPPKPLPPAPVQTYSVDYRVMDPQFRGEAARSGNQAMLEFALAAFDAEGHMLNGVINDAIREPSAQPTENNAGLYRARQSLVVPLNAVSIRVGVRDRVSDRMGTLEIPLPLAPGPTAQPTGQSLKE
jgi:VWFA-related protein